jgi:hypothetical protein
MFRAILIVAALAPFARAEQWKVQYFFDELNKTFNIADIAFPSPTHGIAVGTIIDDSGKDAKGKNIALITADGGEHWETVPLKDHPRSLFFLNDSTGWLVTDDAILITEESGHEWKKIGDQKKPNHKLGPTPPGGLITRVWFLDHDHGFAAGLQKSVFETRDAGKTWAPVDEAATPSANPGYSAYTQLFFDKKYGVAVGGSRPPRPDDPHLPSWMEPDRATKRREVPTLTFMIETVDGGANWKVSTAPLIGTLTAFKSVGATALAVMSYAESFEWPSEVFRMDLRNGKSTPVFKQKDRRVMDCAIYPGRAYLAAVEPPGKLNTVPIPGKVKILTSEDYENWTEMDVSYKAVARSLVFAGPDADHQWAATDTGMILHLVR